MKELIKSVEQNFFFQIAIMGSPGVGKTSLLKWIIEMDEVSK